MEKTALRIQEIGDGLCIRPAHTHAPGACTLRTAASTTGRLKTVPLLTMPGLQSRITTTDQVVMLRLCVNAPDAMCMRLVLTGHADTRAAPIS